MFPSVVTVTRKVPTPLPVDHAADRIREFGAWRVFSSRLDDVLSAVALQKKAQLSFWDAMIVESASQLGCDTLWTEDLTEGQKIAGVRIRNPLAD